MGCCYCYLHQGGYVIVIVYLCACLLAIYAKKFQTDLHEIFREGWQWLNGQMIIFLVAKNDFIFWWQSGSRSAY